MTLRCSFLRLLALCLLFLPAAGLTAEGPASDEPVVITDATGHSVALERLPERIAIAGKATILVENAVFLFEAAETRVIALENRRQSAFRFLPLIDPEISQKTVFAVNAGPEQIAATKPDLVLMKNFMAGSLGPPLKKLNIPVLYLNLETPDDFYRDIQTLGAVFGNPERAETINQFYQTRINRVRELSSNINKRPRVLLLEYSPQGGETAFGVPPASWMQTRLVEIAGGRPVWKDLSVSRGWTIVTVEQIASWDPDQIFLVDYAGNAVSAAADLQKSPIWSNLRAVQNNSLHAFAFDFYSWDQPGTHWILGLEWLATRIHPETNQDINMMDEIERFYSTLYRLSRETIKSEVLPRLQADLSR